MSIVIKASAQVTEEENRQLDWVCDQAYAGDESDLSWTDEQDWRVWLAVEDQIVSCLTIVEREARVGETPVRLAGIGGVATRPDQQHKGYAGQVLVATAEFLRQRLAVDFGMLVCTLELRPYYARFGWQAVDEALWIDQPGGKIVPDLDYMILPCTDQPWPAGELDLCGLPW